MGVLAAGTELGAGKFVVASLLGRGSAGEVYLARQPRMDREVAIKVLSEAVAEIPDALRRFEREARAAGSLVHPNILPVYDFDLDPALGVWFLVTQYVAGGHTLRERLGSALPLTDAAPIIAGLAGALDTAHERGIIHRDVKPANILMDEDRPLLTDFGLAHLNSMPKMTATGTVLGTPKYMAPEQALGQPVGPASDQYSLGIIAYELLAGQAPFIGFGMGLLDQHVRKPPPPLLEHNPALPAAVGAAVARALAKRPEDRFPTCLEFARVLLSTAPK